MPQAGSRGQKSSVKMDRHYLLPIAERQLVNAANDLVTCIAAQDIYPAVSVNGSCYCRLHCLFVGYVHRHSEHLAAGMGRDLSCGRLRMRLLEVSDHHPGALGSKALCNAAADARSRSGDDCCFAL